jgi:hypothetical protein
MSIGNGEWKLWRESETLSEVFERSEVLVLRTLRG